jgi:hypothetical protein
MLLLGDKAPEASIETLHPVVAHGEYAARRDDEIIPLDEGGQLICPGDGAVVDGFLFDARLVLTVAASREVFTGLPAQTCNIGGKSSR